ncbi:MAG: MlaD family protein [Prolixibacteraceae bacterium]|jgi:phospholipid/cholesterol/gamma-HCH transport system substrate-binding protein|nr:MlaD family protein [Prolixibacteraceae bacterium]
MNTNTPKFKVRLGLFIIGGGVLFLLALFILGKQKNLFNPVFKLTADFHNISGLEVGCNIRFAGINVGAVDNIDFLNDSTVQIDLLVNKSVQQFIKEDCQATIGSSGIIGDRVVVITQGGFNSTVAKDGQHIDSKEPIETDDIMASIQKSAGSVETISAQLAEIMIKVNSGHGTLGRLINDVTIAQDLSESSVNLKKSSKQISEILVDINSGHGTLGKVIRDSTIANDLAETMVNLKYSSQGLDELLEAAKHNFLFRGYFNKQENKDEKEKSRGNYHTTERRSQQSDDEYSGEDLQQLASGVQVEIDTLMTSLKVSAINSEVITAQLADIMVMINSGKGTLGMLVQDTVLANVINQTLLNMKSGSKGLDENMNAAKENFLFKGYFQRKKKKAAKKKEAKRLEKKEEKEK